MIYHDDRFNQPRRDDLKPITTGEVIIGIIAGIAVIAAVIIIACVGPELDEMLRWQ